MVLMGMWYLKTEQTCVYLGIQVLGQCWVWAFMLGHASGITYTCWCIYQIDGVRSKNGSGQWVHIWLTHTFVAMSWSNAVLVRNNT